MLSLSERDDAAGRETADGVSAFAETSVGDTVGAGAGGGDGAGATPNSLAKASQLAVPAAGCRREERCGTAFLAGTAADGDALAGAGDFSGSSGGA